MACIIIALPKREDARRIAGVVRKRMPELEIYLCSSASSVLREANERDGGVVLCTARTKDMSYADLSEYLPQYFGLIVMTSQDGVEQLNPRMRVLQLPLRTGDLFQMLESLLGGSKREQKPKKKIVTKRDEEQKLVITQAKELLMRTKDMTEPEAYRYIQKESMNQGRTMVESAQMILLLNNNWD